MSDADLPVPDPAAVPVAEVDRAFPETHVGPLEPNYYCRAWNGKRVKYCRARAGAGTQHPGVGRCKFHGGLQPGDTRLTHGATSRYLVAVPRFRALIDAYRADADPFNVLEELSVARALLHDWLVRSAPVPTPAGSDQPAAPAAAPRPPFDLGDVTRLLDTISKVIYRAEQIRQHGTVSIERLRLFLLALDRGLELEIADTALRLRVRKMIHAIRV